MLFLIFIILLVYFIVAIASRISEKKLNSAYGTVVSKREEKDYWYIKFNVDSEDVEYKLYIKSIYDKLEKGMKGTLFYKNNILEDFFRKS